MQRFTRLIAILTLFLLCLPVFAQSDIAATSSGDAITADNAADVVPLARYGRGTAGAFAWSPDGTALAVGGSAGIWLYKTADFEGTPMLLTGHTAPVTSLAFDSTGAHLVSGGADSSLNIWDAKTGDLLQTLEVPYSATFNTVDYSPDDSLIVTASLNTLLVWNAESGELQNQLTVDPTASVVKVAFAPEAPTLAVLAANGALTLWDVSAGTQTSTLPVAETVGTDIAWTADGTGLVFIVAGGWQLYDAASGSLTSAGGSGAQSAQTGASLDSESSTLALGDENSVQLWNLTTGENLGALDAGEPVLDLEYSTDGSALAGLTKSGTLIVWDTATQQASVTLPNAYHNSGALSAVFNPDASQIAANYQDTTGALIDPKTGEFSASLTGTGTAASTTALAYSPDGTALAVSDGFGISVKDAESGEENAYLKTIFAPVFAWSPDGSVIAAGDSSGTLYLWDASGALLLSRKDHTLPVTGISFSADGSTLLTASTDGTIRTYGIAE